MTVTKPAPKVGSLVISGPSTVRVGEKITLSVSAYDTDGNFMPGVNVNKNIDNTRILSWDTGFTVKGNAPGTAVVKITAASVSASVTITVTE